MEVVIAFLLQAESAAAPEMTTGAWIFIAGAWTAIISLVVFCFSKILRGSNKQQ